MKKKILSLLLITVMVTSCLAVVPVYAANRDPYIETPATTFDAEDHSHTQSTFSASGQSVGGIWKGDWLCYKNMDFGDYGPYAVDVGMGVPEGYATAVQIRIDAPDGKLIASVPIVATATFNTLGICSGVINTKVTGIHDVYLSLDTKTANFFSFCFYGINPDKFDYVSYSGNSSYSDLGNDSIGHSADILSQLGMLPKEEGKLDAIMPVKRGEFATAVYRMYKKNEGSAFLPNEGDIKQTNTGYKDVSLNSPYAEGIGYLSEIGIMNGVGNNEFKPDDYINITDAITVVMRVLGYKDLAEIEGGYPNGYIKLARRKRVMWGDADISESLRRGNMALLLHSALQADYLSMSSIDADGYTEYEPKECFLGETQKTYREEGVVKASAISTLTMPDSGLGKKEVIINDVLYNIGSTNAIGLLGYECEFFFEDTKAGRVIRSIAPLSSAELTEISGTNDSIVELTKDKIIWNPKNDDEQKEFIPNPNTAFIYNGVAVDDSLENIIGGISDFKGFVRIVENPDKSTVVIIEEYADYLIETINSSTGTIIGKGIAEPLNLGRKEELILIKDSTGEELVLSKLKTGDLITVYESKNTVGRKLIRVTAAENVVEGKITRIEKGVYTINGMPYGKSKNCTANLSLGTSGKFRLNIYNDIVAASQTSTDVYRLGVFMGSISVADGFGLKNQVKIVNDSGKLEILTVANKFTGDGIKLTDESEIYNGTALWTGIKNILAETGIRYKVNAEGVVTLIDTPEMNEGGANDSLKPLDVSGTTYTYNTTHNTLVSTDTADYGGKFYVPKTAKTFAFYDTGIGEKENNCIVGAINTIVKDSGWDIKGKVYSTVGEDYTADFIIWSNFNNLLGFVGNRTYMVFTERSTRINENSEVVDVIRGWSGKDLEFDLGEEFISDDEQVEILNSIEKGDVLYLTLFPKDKIVRKISVVAYNDGEAKRVGVSGTEFAATVNKTTGTAGTRMDSRFIYGKVVARTSDYIVVKKGNGKNTVVSLGGCSVASSGVRPGDSKYILTAGMGASSIAVGNTVFAYIYMSNTQMIVIYEDVEL